MIAELAVQLTKPKVADPARTSYFETECPRQLGQWAYRKLTTIRTTTATYQPVASEEQIEQEPIEPEVLQADCAYLQASRELQEPMGRGAQ